MRINVTIIYLLFLRGSVATKIAVALLYDLLYWVVECIFMNPHKLKIETTAWVAEGIISETQAEKICARYSHEIPPYKKMSFWLQSVAATLAGFALFLVISENWQRMGWATQSIVVATPLFVAQFFALWSERRENFLIAEICWFIASLALGANIMLQAQIFHISAYYPNGILFWVIGILPILYLRVSTIHFFLGVILFGIYLILQLSYSQFNLISSIPLLLFAWFAWAKQRLFTALLFLFILYFFLYTILAHWQISTAGFIWEYAFILFAITLLQRFVNLSQGDLNKVYVIFFALAQLFAIFMTFSIFARKADLYRASFAALAIIFISCVLLIKKRQSLREHFWVWLIAGNVGVMLLCSAGYKIIAFGDKTLFLRIAANVVYLTSAVVLMFHAIHGREKKFFMGSVVAILLWALVRYFDLFANYLVTALIFGLSAFALVAANKLWERNYEK